MHEFFSGAVVMASFVAGLIFFRFWKKTGDRLFAIFGIAFWILGVNRIALSMFRQSDESQTWLYLVRFAAFALILFAIIDKNRGGGAPDRTNQDKLA